MTKFKVKAVKVFSKMGETQIEEYEKDCPNYDVARKDEIRLLSLGDYSNIRVVEVKEPSS
jgi:hypothetical protein